MSYFFFIGIFILGFYKQAPHQVATLFWLIGIGLGALCFYPSFKRWLAVYSRHSKLKASQRREKRQQQHLVDEWNGVTMPTMREFLAQTPIIGYQPFLVHRAHAILGAVYGMATFDQTILRPAQAQVLYEQLVSATNAALIEYGNNLPVALRTSDKGLFTYTYVPTFEELRPANQALADHFTSFSAILPRTEAKKDPCPTFVVWDETKIASERKAFERKLKDYDKYVQELWDAQTPEQQLFSGTSLYRFADHFAPGPITLPFGIPDSSRFAGTWIVAPPGRGKTNLLHNLIKQDRAKSCTIVLMDSKGDLINSYKGYGDALVIDPSNVEINPFQLGSSTRTLDFLEYIFSALLDTKLTPKQTTLFRCCLALMLKIPDATIETFRKLLVHGWKDQEPYVMQLDEMNRDFFSVDGRKSEFDGGQYNETKQEVLQRLRLLVSNDYLKKIFTAQQSNTNFFALLDSGKIIIIDNSKDELGENGAEFFGRFFVAMVWMAAVSRSKLRQDQKLPVYFYIDECQTVIKRDTKITTILDECRSQKIALIMAHQRIGQIEPHVMDALNNCAVRLTNSDDDAEALAKRFRVDSAALRLPIGKFSCFVRDKTPAAIAIDVPEFDMSIFPPAPETHKTSTPPPSPPPHNEQPHSVPNDEVEDF
ncbi:type IV secretory system conjugative DNA transfer family protein [Bradyrhizobium cytisi]|uniref:Type IV secretion system DNA-binding domain-containig protein n=1 Tax=Bradyrhizobium cytisi TaxID=515489 RepID=A0A5S4WW70_9BRAD|nr:type IV secretion system DNA-binding domain-containing protein [Bradyrhizobium cytisi]TYL86307.1 type IV secretion system DNA-binding domain-containig protein [Bradyrhizobium cytisi]